MAKKSQEKYERKYNSYGGNHAGKLPNVYGNIFSHVFNESDTKFPLSPHTIIKSYQSKIQQGVLIQFNIPYLIELRLGLFCVPDKLLPCLFRLLRNEFK